jgi:hypothetical protein
MAIGSKKIKSKLCFQTSNSRDFIILHRLLASCHTMATSHACFRLLLDDSKENHQIKIKVKIGLLAHPIGIP